MPLIISLSLFSLSAVAQNSVITYHNDNARTGRDLSEYLLTPANVKPGLFGRRFSQTVDGSVLGQPLYLPNVNIAGKGPHNVVFVATSHDSVYAFDADSDSGANAQPLWQVSFINPANGVTAVPAEDVNCPVIKPEIGIAGTPVIDAASGTLYVIAETKEPGPKYVFRLHALDVTSGAERTGSPVETTAPGFVPLAHKQRTALLLSRGEIYASWSSHCDRGDYHGWVMSYDAGTLTQSGVFNVSPDGDAGSFWNGGAGPSADDDGNVYVVSANGTFDMAGSGDYGDSVVKLSPAPALSVEDYFTPFNQAALSLKDNDLGSGGALLLPDETGNAAHPHPLFVAGKEGRMYLLDRDHLGNQQNGTDASALESLPVLSHSLFGMPAYFNGAVYVSSEFSPLRAYRVNDADLAMSPFLQSSMDMGELGTTPSISANGSQNGIVWTVPSDNAGILRAFDAATLNEIYDSNQQPGDLLGSWSEFAVPTIADGKVYVGTFNSLVVYGEQTPYPTGITAVANAASYAPGVISPGSLISVFGSGLALATVSAPSTPLPISLADVSVTVNGVPAPLLFVSPGQINAQAPVELTPGAATVVVRTGNSISAATTVQVQAAAPGIFTSADGTNQAAALNDNDADDVPNNPGAPAPVGSIVSLFFTGQGPVNAQLRNGVPASGEAPVPALLSISATVGGVPAEVTFAGLAPGYVGVAQMNLKVPPLASGNYPVVISAGGVTSNSAILTVGGE
ncbi:MAG: IPT/TIG domain-containing protein [Bryobacteraceae bacterium]